jgi:Mrp family chromosome partitioning ATPase
MADLVEEMKKEYEVVLFDTPALSSVADAAVLVPFVDEVVLVVAQAYVHHDAIQTVFDQLTNIKPNSISVVVNRSKANSKTTYYDNA